MNNTNMLPLEFPYEQKSTDQGIVPGDLYRPGTLFLSQRGRARKDH